VKQATHNRAALAAMILAALACYANAPRLASTLLVGDAANLIAVADANTRLRMEARISELPKGNTVAQILSERLNEGQESLAVTESLPPLVGVVAPSPLQSRFDIKSGPAPRTPGADFAAGFALLPGAVLTTSLPPPPDVGAQAPFGADDCASALRQTARAPPTLS